MNQPLVIFGSLYGVFSSSRIFSVRHLRNCDFFSRCEFWKNIEMYYNWEFNETKNRGLQLQRPKIQNGILKLKASLSGTEIHEMGYKHVSF